MIVRLAEIIGSMLPCQRMVLQLNARPFSWRKLRRIDIAIVLKEILEKLALSARGTVLPQLFNCNRLQKHKQNEINLANIQQIRQDKLPTDELTLPQSYDQAAS